MSGKFIALGSNLSYREKKPLQILQETVEALEHMDGIHVLARSSWWSSKAYPCPHEPPYVNGVINIQTFFTPENLLLCLHKLESYYGRKIKRKKWSSRTLDLDILDYEKLCIKPPESLSLYLPHPYLAKRPFVLFPLMDIAPHWKHPFDGSSIGGLLKKIPQKYLDQTQFLAKH